MAENKNNEADLNPVARVILRGLYDPGSPWHVFLGMHYILKAIWQDVLTFYKSKIAIPRHFSFTKVKWGHSYTSLDSPSDWLVRFPEPTDINVNMMPFVMEKRFRDTRLPDYLRQYFEQIVSQCIVESERGKIGYLTIHESFVEKGTSQRRPGIHTESPGVLMLKGGKGNSNSDRRLFRWGGGLGEKETVTITLHGGIYMASNVANSCKVWNCEILKPEGRNSPDVVGEHGDIEHLRSLLPSKCETMDANTVYWMTDRTPHESLPLSEGTYRQYFRLVTSQVSGWFEDHSTKNPLGVVPDPKITKIIKGSKFDLDSCYIVDTAAE
ncbi:uncharacterized protein LOC114516711 [Dendronephthya gigantea]|uniref:uncharacterized protein LOC114516711 n=1 Tax=Dendronephthya gigantea TaxID=151771 RepID=UPI001069DCA0|nr:uncharacterized protein LOC114516711 [Dendronephthya gigantea]